MIWIVIFFFFKFFIVSFVVLLLLPVPTLECPVLDTFQSTVALWEPPKAINFENSPSITYSVNEKMIDVLPYRDNQVTYQFDPGTTSLVTAMANTDEGDIVNCTFYVVILPSKGKRKF